MNPSLFCAFFLALMLTVGADPADDLSQYKTADALWAHVMDQTKALGQALQNRDPSIKDLAPEILANARAFAAQYPRDAHTWDAKMLAAQVGGLALRLQIPSAPTEADLAQEFNDIAGSPDAPKVLRAEANAFLISETLQRAGEEKGDPAGASWDEADARIADFEKQFGPDFSFQGTHPAIVMLRAQQMESLKNSGDPARYEALLRKLSADPQLQVAAMAAQALAEEKNTAGAK
jgi:hypothetical protein